VIVLVNAPEDFMPEHIADTPKLPTDRTDPLLPPDGFAALRAGPPAKIITPDGKKHWLVCRYSDVRTVLSDERFSADDTHPNFPRINSITPAPGLLSFLRADDPEHGRLRRMLTAEFTVRRINAMRPEIESSVDELLDNMVKAGRPTDLVQSFALPLSSLVICQLLGVPYADRELFQSRASTAISFEQGEEVATAALIEVAGYLDGLVAAKVAHPTDDLIGRVARDQVATGRLGHDELVSMARLLLLAGHETTANMLALGTLLLLRSPGRLAQLRVDPALIEGAVEELLRYLSIVQLGIARRAVADVTVGGTDIKAGEGVVISLPAADHDPAHFASPDELDLHRTGGHHVAFGYGMHQCLGQTLARLEMEVAFNRMLARLPGLRAADDNDDIVYRDNAIIYGLRGLRVTW
jgi:hypothetical protein